jgi:tetratricopeptide (TPR) repeat protein
VAEALEHAHANKVVHGDVKPANVLLTFFGHALLIDFNLAFDETSTIYQMGGTPAYVAPELFASVAAGTEINQLHPTAEADIYAWGVVAWEMLTGQLSESAPASAKRPHLSRLIREHQARQRTFGEKTLLRLSVDPALASLILRCLAISPEVRPTAGEIVARLQEWRTTRATFARSVRRNRNWIAASAAAIILASVGAFSWLLVQPPRHLQEIRLARLALAAGELRDATDHVNQALIYSPQSLEAKLLQCDVFIAQGNPESAAQQYLEISPKISNDLIPQVKSRLGYCRLLQKDYPSAASLFQEAIDGGLQESWLLNNLGVALRRQRKFAEATDRLTEALQQSPSQSLIYLCRAECVAYADGAPDAKSVNAALEDVNNSLKLGAPHADHFAVMAVLWDRSANAQAHSPDVQACITRSIALGMDPNSVIIKRLIKKHSLVLPQDLPIEQKAGYVPLFRFLPPPVSRVMLASASP